jgi:hypothetical protein
MKAATCPTGGSWDMGMNIPLMKRSGIRTEVKGIITSPGFSVGIDANIMPIAENTREDRAKPSTRVANPVTVAPRAIMPISRESTETDNPKIIPAKVFPKRREIRDRGADRYLSKVLSRRSNGMDVGPTDDEAQKTV